LFFLLYFVLIYTLKMAVELPLLLICLVAGLLVAFIAKSFFGSKPAEKKAHKKEKEEPKQHKKEKEEPKQHKKEKEEPKQHKTSYAAVAATSPTAAAASSVDTSEAPAKKKKTRSNKSKAKKTVENKSESLAVSSGPEKDDEPEDDTDSVASDAIIPSKAAQALLKKSKEMVKARAAASPVPEKEAEKAPEKEKEKPKPVVPAKKAAEPKKAASGKKGKKEAAAPVPEPVVETAPVEPAHHHHKKSSEDSEHKGIEVVPAPDSDWAVVETKHKNKPKKDEEGESTNNTNAAAPEPEVVEPPKEEEDDEPPAPTVEVVTSDVIVDASKLGLLIGPKGNTKIAIQQATGTIIQMPRAGKDVEGDVTIVVSGPQEGVNKAVAALNELASKGYANMLVPEGFQESYVAVHQKYLPDIIGKSGSVIRALNNHTGVKITVPSVTKQPGLDGKIPKVKIGLAGPKDKVSECRALIKELTKSYVTPVTHPNQTSLDMDIPKNYYNYIIGSKGSEIKHIQNSYKVQVHIPDENSVNPNVVLVGEEAAVQNAQKHIQKIIDRVNGVDKDGNKIESEGSGKYQKRNNNNPAAAAGGENVPPMTANAGEEGDQHQHAAPSKAVAPPAPGLTQGKSHWASDRVRMPANNNNTNAAGGAHHPPGDEPDEAWTREFLPPTMGMDIGSMLPPHAKYANTNAASNQNTATTAGTAVHPPIGHNKPTADKNPTPSGLPTEPKVPAGASAWHVNAVNTSQW
jgi:rRNA processing protein Krr1/Pno1